MYLETLRSRIDTHAKDTTVHVTADEKSLWNSLASLFELVNIGTEESPLMAIQAKYGLFSDSFISARGSDPEAGQGGGSGGLDVQAMWYALAQPTNEKINVSHIPELTISKITGLQGELDSKLSGITGEMVTEALGYTPYDASQIGSASVAYAASAGKVENALTINNDGGSPSASAKSYNGSAAVTINIPTTLPASDVYSWAKQPVKPSYTFSEIGSKPSTLSGYGITDGVNAAEATGHLNASVSGHTLSIGVASGYAIPTASQITLWDKICALFDVDTEGNVYVTGSKGFYSNSFISARGSDPGAGSGGGSGVDMESVWYALGQPTTEKINVSHIPALQQLSGSLTNAQLANSAITVAGVSVSLGGSVSTEQIASALGLGSNAYTSTAYLPLAGGTMTGHITLGGANSSSLLVQMHDDNSNYRTALGWKSAASGTLIAQIGYWNSAQKITLNPCSDEVSEIWNDAAGKYNFVVGKNWLSYNTYPILHSVNYTDYTVTKTGTGASGTWPISVSGTADDASKLGGIYSADYMSHFRQSGVNIDTYATRSPKIIEVSEAAGTKPVSTLWLQVMQWGSNDPDYGFQMAHQYSSYGNLYFRQKASGAWGGWRTLLDTRNYASYLDSRYVEKSGDTMNGTLTLLCGGNNYDQGIRINRPTLADWATLTIGCVGSGTSGTSANTWLIGTPANSNSLIFCLNDSSDQKGLCLRDMTNTGLRWNGYGVWHAGLQGSGSGLDADLLDGYQSTSFNLATNLGACEDYGVYVIGLMQITDYTTEGNMANGTLIFIRQNGNNPAQKIIYSLSTRYGSNNVRFGYLTLSTNIYVQPCTFTYNGKKWAGFQVSSVSSYQSGVVCVRDGLRLGERSTPFLLKYGVSNTRAVINSEVNSSVVINGADIIESGVHSNAFFGNASSATKLATARSIWGRSFDGSGDIRGNIIVGDAIIHGSVTSNNTRFISSDNASNIYFSVGGLVGLVAEPSCLRRGASNTSETLGTSTCRWANVYAANGDYSGNMTVSGWINNALILSQKGVSADNSDTTTFHINGHILEFGGRGYAHQTYYFRPQYSANGATYADMYIQNASAADSPVFSTTHAFYHNGNAYHYGNLGLGTAAPQAKLDVIGTIRATTGIWSNGYVSAKGQDTTSDARYKRDVASLPAQAALAVLMRLRPSTWAWKDDGRRGAGFIAQEVMGVLPEAVREVGGGEDRHLALNYQMLHAYEVSALQTHETELERLRGRVLLLENEIKRIRHGS